MIRGLLLVGLLALLALPAEAADALPASARAEFLRTRDAGRLLEALDAAGVPADDGWRGLAYLAADRMPTHLPRDAAGAQALPAAVLALRGLDLAGAQTVLRRVGESGGRAVSWLQALLHLRRGDDGGAVGALLAPPVFEPERDAFPLALLGAALDVEDRRLLAAGARIALERAAARGRVPAVRGVASGAAVLDPRSAPRTLAFAVRVLRRMGELDGAAAIVAAAPAAGVVVRGTTLAFEAALLAWVRGEQAAMPTLLAGTPPDGIASAWLALRRARRRARVSIPTTWRHEPSLRANAAAIASLASALGRPTSAAEVASWARRSGRETWHTGSMRAFFEAQRFAVLSHAGDPKIGDELLRAGLPFLVLRLEPDGRGWRERPSVVHGYDRSTGLWLLQTPDGHGVDVMLRSEATKARIFGAVPLGRRAGFASFGQMVSARAGARIEQALDEADRGALESAVARLGPGAPDGGPVQWLYAAHVAYRQAQASGEDAHLRAAAAAAARSRRTPPALGFEAYLLGAREAADGNVDGAVASFRTARRLEGTTTTVQLAAFVAELAAGRRDDALASLERARDVDPTDVTVLFHRGTLRASAGDGINARRDFRRALDRRPAYVGVAVALARLDVQERRYADALEVLKTTARQDAKLRDDPILEKARRSAEIEWIRNAEKVGDLRGMRRSASPETRRLLAYELARRSAEPDEAEAELREILGDADEQVRITALQVYLRPWLRRRIQEDAVLCRRIGQALAQDGAPRVRAAAAAVLARVPAEHARRVLIEAVAGGAADGVPAVRAAAARGLANHDAKVTLAALVAALEDDAVEVRQAASESLFRLTGTDRGFQAEDTAAARADAVAAWRAWLAEQD